MPSGGVELPSGAGRPQGSSTGRRSRPEGQRHVDVSRRSLSLREHARAEVNAGSIRGATTAVSNHTIAQMFLIAILLSLFPSTLRVMG